MKKKNVAYVLLFLIATSLTSCVVQPRGYAYGPPPPRHHGHHHYNGW